MTQPPVNAAPSVAKEDALLRSAAILIAEDDAQVRRLLERLLRNDGYTAIHATGAAAEVVTAVQRTGAKLLLLDLHLPEASGFDVMQRLQDALPAEMQPEIIVLTGDHSPAARHRALDSGAADFLTKPPDHLEVLLRVRNLLRMRALQTALREQNQRLEAMVQERTAELDRTQIEILERLARAAEHRDDDTGQHTRRVADLAGRLAVRLGLEPAEAELIRRGALLHDVGKIALPDSVLLKRGALTIEERLLMQRHTTAGAAILFGSSAPLLRVAERIARSHHERWDGSGYPEGLAGEDIPLAARIVAVADTFDALTNERPYKPAWSVAEALSEINAQGGRQFDPRVVAELMGLIELTARH